jgi:hypothetical protein
MRTIKMTYNNGFFFFFIYLQPHRLQDFVYKKLQDYLKNCKII